MYATRYLKVASLEAAQAALSQGDDPKLLAGGMTLLPTLKQRLAAPDLLIDLAACDLSHITDQGDSLRIGAMTAHADVASSDLVQQAIPALAELAGGIGVARCAIVGPLAARWPIMIRLLVIRRQF